MNFNSRPSARGDDCQRIQPFLHFISIHAPPRGATVFQFRNVKRICISIHAPPRGATGASAPRRCLRRYFNSRPSARGDWFGRNYFRWNRISIHAPPRGATGSGETTFAGIGFQFTPLREGRPKQTEQWLSFSYFNSRPSARGDRFRVGIPQRPSYFNSRPSARGD